MYHDEPEVTIPPSHTDDDASECDSQKEMFLESIGDFINFSICLFNTSYNKYFYLEESDEEDSVDGSDVIRGVRDLDLDDEEDLEEEDMNFFHKSSLAWVF
jgi:hypothetical protein